ncbi:MAG: hypothetical protein A2X94_09095 [Bdellovibrionales bacterium GWB1_55_8]|nr:MAG: hypothetical protein A2X94_09095 [Bdellovibrionales bacterium GWB1_55_8]
MAGETRVLVLSRRGSRHGVQRGGKLFERERLREKEASVQIFQFLMSRSGRCHQNGRRDVRKATPDFEKELVSVDSRQRKVDKNGFRPVLLLTGFEIGQGLLCASGQDRFVIAGLENQT